MSTPSKTSKQKEWPFEVADRDTRPYWELRVIEFLEQAHSLGHRAFVFEEEGVDWNAAISSKPRNRAGLLFVRGRHQWLIHCIDGNSPDEEERLKWWYCDEFDLGARAVLDWVAGHPFEHISKRLATVRISFPKDAVRTHPLGELLHQRRIVDELRSDREEFLDQCAEVDFEAYQCGGEFPPGYFPALRYWLQDNVVAVLRRPKAITADDLLDLFRQHVLYRGETDFGECYDSFVQSAVGAARTHQVSEPFPIMVATAVPEVALGKEIGVNLWKGNDGGFLQVSGVLPGCRLEELRELRENDVDSDLEMRDVRTVFATLHFNGTKAAFTDALREMQPVVRSIVKSYIMIYRILEEERASRRRDRLWRWMGLGGYLSEKSDTAEESDSDETPENMQEDHAGETTELEESTTEEVARRKTLGEIGELLTAHFEASGEKKDSISRRIRNALYLLVQADQQSQHAIGLALSVAAIEAMLCQKGDNLAAMFAENMAALLEPDPRWRPHAVRKAKTLYRTRSAILHGAETEFSVHEMRDARLLAAAVLKAFLERRSFRKRMGHADEKPDELLRELSDDKYTPGQLTGVEESPLVMLWREGTV